MDEKQTQSKEFCLITIVHLILPSFLLPSLLILVLLPSSWMSRLLHCHIWVKRTHKSMGQEEEPKWLEGRKSIVLLLLFLCFLSSTDHPLSLVRWWWFLPSHLFLDTTLLQFNSTCLGHILPSLSLSSIAFASNLLLQTAITCLVRDRH